MNSFGRIFRVSIFGVSHGESVGIVIDGCPAGLSLSAEDLLPDLERRKGGQGKGTTPRKEDDYPFFKAASLMVKQPAHLSLSFLKIIIQEAKIIINKEVFHVRDMQIG